MAYMRGKYYIWGDSKRVHFWAADGDDGWKACGWADSVKKFSKRWQVKRGQKPSGVSVPYSIIDEFVMMRLAQMIDERTITPTLQRLLKWPEPFASLRSHGKAILRQLRSLKPDPDWKLWQRLTEKHKSKHRFKDGLVYYSVNVPKVREEYDRLKEARLRRERKKAKRTGALLRTR